MQCLAVPPSIVGLKLVNLPQFTSMHPKFKKKMAINTEQLAYTFSKLGDNLTKNNRDILIDISNST